VHTTAFEASTEGAWGYGGSWTGNLGDTLEFTYELQGDSYAVRVTPIESKIVHPKDSYYRHCIVKVRVENVGATAVDGLAQADFALFSNPQEPGLKPDASDFHQEAKYPLLEKDAFMQPGEVQEGWVVFSPDDNFKPHAFGLLFYMATVQGDDGAYIWNLP